MDFHGISGDENCEAINTLFVEENFRTELTFAVDMGQSRMRNKDRPYEHTREELAEMTLKTLRILYPKNHYKYEEIMILRRKEQRRWNTEQHRLFDRRKKLKEEKFELELDIQKYQALMQAENSGIPLHASVKKCKYSFFDDRY
ncbi:hypothetical protein LOD99_4415 [Oopsacas minuta]|uniref:Uncharacterized protein n=1 Tax=Oopsacas minuta TaxID=111878 RepID=A0AAV7JWE3_9METZ|nr:hypothetical protein LOD99_4415 [Oopsacas minuta]